MIAFAILLHVLAFEESRTYRRSLAYILDRGGRSENLAFSGVLRQLGIFLKKKHTHATPIYFTM